MLINYTPTPKKIQAVQDYDYIKTFSRQTYDPFVASSERFLDDHLLDLTLSDKKNMLTLEHLKATAIPTGP